MPKEEDVNRYANSFVLFPNRGKKKDSHPDQVGYLTDENGKVWRLASWTQTSKTGKSKYISGKITEFHENDRPEQEPDMPDLPI